MPEYRIPDLVRMVERKEIDIPELQREFVWSDNQVRDLAESIYKNYPIGVITLYKVPEECRRENERYWVLDGQQRLLSLTLIMKGHVEALIRGRLQTKRLTIYFDPKNERFEIRQPRRGENWIELSKLLQITDRFKLEEFLRSRGLNIDEQIKVSTLWSRFREDVRIFVHELPEDLDLDDLGNIFVRTNFGGTQVKGSDVYSTMIAITQRDLVKELREFCTRLPIDIDYGILIRTFIAFLTQGKVKLAGRVLDQARKLKELLRREQSRIRTIAESVKACTEEAIRLLRDEMGIMTKRYLPTENVIPVMAYYISKKKNLSGEDKTGLLKWFVLASYFRRYSTSAETRLNEDLSTIEGGGDYKDLIKNIEKTEGDLKERIKKDIAEGKVNELLLYAILKQNDAKDFETREDLNTGNITIHHIFPKSFLISSGYENIVDDIGNLTLITPGTNQRLSSELPENYLGRIPPEIREAHLIPNDEKLWRSENCKDFIKERKKLLEKSVEEFFQGLY